MTESIIYKGYWSQPLNPSEEFTGELTLSSDGHITLSLLGGFGELSDMIGSAEIPIINGVDAKGKKITLLKSTPISFSMGGYHSVKYHVSFVFEGHHFNNQTELNFTAIKLQLSLLNRWVDTHGFKLNHEIQKGVNVNYTLPESIPFDFDSTFRGKIFFSHKFNLPTDFKIELVQNTWVEFAPKDGSSVSFSELLKPAEAFVQFISIYTQRVPYYKAIELVLPEDAKLTVPKKPNQNSVELHLRQRNKDYAAEEVDSVHYLFGYVDIENDFENILKRYAELREQISPVLFILHEGYQSNKIYDENRFLNVVQALETFHRRLRKTEKEELDNHGKKLLSVLEAAPREHKKWLEEKLRYSHEPSLRQRIKALLEEYDSPFVRSLYNSDKKGFINGTVNTRNYLTHYEESLKSSALFGSKRVRLTQRLERLLQVVVLHELGVDKALIEKRLTYQHRGI